MNQKLSLAAAILSASIMLCADNSLHVRICNEERMLHANVATQCQNGESFYHLLSPHSSIEVAMNSKCQSFVNYGINDMLYRLVPQLDTNAKSMALHLSKKISYYDENKQCNYDVPTVHKAQPGSTILAALIGACLAIGIPIFAARFNYPRCCEPG